MSLSFFEKLGWFSRIIGLLLILVGPILFVVISLVDNWKDYMEYNGHGWTLLTRGPTGLKNKLRG